MKMQRGNEEITRQSRRKARQSQDNEQKRTDRKAMDEPSNKDRQETSARRTCVNVHQECLRWRAETDRQDPDYLAGNLVLTHVGSLACVAVADSVHLLQRELQRLDRKRATGGADQHSQQQ